MIPPITRRPRPANQTHWNVTSQTIAENSPAPIRSAARTRKGTDKDFDMAVAGVCATTIFRDLARLQNTSVGADHPPTTRSAVANW